MSYRARIRLKLQKKAYIGYRIDHYIFRLIRETFGQTDHATVQQQNLNQIWNLNQWKNTLFNDFVNNKKKKHTIFSININSMEVCKCLFFFYKFTISTTVGIGKPILTKQYYAKLSGQLSTESIVFHQIYSIHPPLSLW